MKGCLTFLGISAMAICMTIAAVVLFIALQPKPVGYADRLTQNNVNTFAAHHTWGDSLTEEGNTEAAQGAIDHLGARAYGMKFGDLMDWEKHRRQAAADAQDAARAKKWRETCAAGSVNEQNDEVCARRLPRVQALALDRRCWSPVSDALDRIVSDQAQLHAAVASTSYVQAPSILDDAASHADAAMAVIENLRSSCPAGYKEAYDAAKARVKTGKELLSVERDILRGVDGSADYARELLRQADVQMLQVGVEHLQIGSLIGIFPPR